jgi:hypothetical protein
LSPTPALKFRVDNNPCSCVLAAPKAGSNVADACGILRYTAPTDTVTMGFTASHPNNFAAYSFSLSRGHNNPPAPVVAGATSGMVSPATNPGTITGTAAGLLGPCVAGGMAAFAESLYVAARTNTGWSRQAPSTTLRISRRLPWLTKSGSAVNVEFPLKRHEDTARRIGRGSGYGFAARSVRGFGRPRI